MSDGRPRRRSRPTPISEIVSSFVARQDGQGTAERRRGVLTVRVFAAFEKLGPPFTQHAEPVHLRSGILTMVVDDSTWLTEMTFLQPELITRINHLVGREVVKEIRLRLGKLSPKKKVREKALPPKVSVETARKIDTWAE